MAEPAPTAPPASGGPGRFRRVMGALAATLGLTTVFVVSLVGAVVLHLDLPPTRRAARMVANQIFAESFKGKLVVGEIDRLSLHGLTIRGATAYDPRGAQVIDAAGLRADADVLGIVKSAVLGTGDLRVFVPLIRLDHADIALERGPDGGPTIAEVFLPKKPSLPPPPSGRKPRVTLDRIEIGHVWAHGGMVQPAGIDGELSGALGRFEVSPDGVAIDVEPTRVDVRAPLPRPFAGNAVFRLHGDGGGAPQTPGRDGGGPQTPGGGPRIEAELDGKLGDLSVHADAKLAGAHVAGRVTIPHATAAAIASLIPVTPPPEIPLRVPVSAVIEAEGQLPEIDFKTRFDFDGGGSATADGRLALRSPLTVDVGLKVIGVDPRAFLDVPSATPVNASAHVWVEAGKAVKIDADATTEPFALAGNSIPAVEAKATFADGRWKAAAKIDEPGAPVHGKVEFDTRDKRLTFEVETKAASLRAIKRVPVPVDGSASVKVKGSFGGGSLDARVSARADGIHAAPGAVALESGGVEGRISGPLDALEVDASAWGSGIQAGFYAWPTANVHVRGPVVAPRIDATLDAGNGESLTASGAVDTKAKAARGLKVQLKRKQGEVTGQVARVAATPRGIEVEGVSLTGAGVGSLKGGLVVTGKEITGKLRGENVDLEKVAHLASYPGHLGGLANVDVDLQSSGPGQRKGHVAVELVDGETGFLHGVSGLFTATFDGDRVRTDGLLRVVSRAGEHERPGERCDGAVAQLRITGGEGRLPGPLLDPRSWQGVSGKVEIAADEWNLRCIRRFVPAFIPVPDVRGKLTTRIKVERAPGARIPTVTSLFARTKGLSVSTATWESQHTDVQLDASLDGTTGETDAKVTVLDEAELASISLGARLDLPTLLDRPSERLASLSRAPLRGKITVPRRPFTAFAGLPTFVTDHLPLLTGRGGQTLAGEIEMDGRIQGTLEAPQIDDHLRVFHLAQVTLVDSEGPPPPVQPVAGKAPASHAGAAGPAGAAASAVEAPQAELRPVEEPVLGPWGLPVDAVIDTSYDGQKAKLEARIEHQQRPMLRAKGELSLPLGDLLAGNVHPAGSFHAELDQVPVGSVPFFADRGVDSKLSGKIDIDGIGGRPKIAVKLDLPRLTVGRVSYDEAELALDVDEPHPTDAGERSTAKLQLTFKGGTGGSLTASASQQLSWKNGLVPQLDPASPAELDLRASRFRLAVAEPFIENVVSRIDGFLDGQSRMSFRPGKKGGGGTRIGDVKLALTGGVFHLPQLGQELHGITLEVSRDEAGKVLFKNIRAQGNKGLLTGSGSADLLGLLPTRTDLAFSIKPGDELPVSYQGAPIGDAGGETKIHVVAKDWTHWDVTVALDPLNLELSPALTRSLTVAGEADNPDIHIRHSIRNDDSAAPSAGGPTIAITIAPLRIGVKGKLLGRVPVEGSMVGAKDKPVHAVIGGRRLRLGGVIELPRFTIGILHKEFVIEGGTVTLNPDDVERSFVNISARWDGPDGAVFVDYAGDLTQLSPDRLKEKLKCRSGDLSQDRCFASLLLGTDQGTASGGGQAAQGQALAAQLIASEFSTEIAGGLSTSIGTGDDGSFRPGLVYKKGNLTTELSTYGAGAAGATTTSAGGAAPKGQHSLLTVDWRFWRNWSMRGKVDVGSDQQTYGADVLWQYRY